MKIPRGNNLAVVCFVMVLSSGLTLRAERGTHEWVVTGPGGLYGFIQYDWVESISDQRVWPISEVTWPISPATHKIRSYTLVYFADRRTSVPLSAPATASMLGAFVAVSVFVTIWYFRRRQKVRF